MFSARLDQNGPNFRLTIVSWSAIGEGLPFAERVCGVSVSHYHIDGDGRIAAGEWLE